MSPRRFRSFSAAVAAALIMAAVDPVRAHEAAGSAGGFMSGFAHPLAGWDHAAAMVAVGIWGAFLQRPAIWMLPVFFPLVMAAGGALGIVGVGLPAVETGIALSAVVLGTMIAAALRPALWVAALIVGGFAVFHGHAHGTELPAAVDPLAYSLGFVLATGLLHVAGIGIGALVQWPAGRLAVRAIGGAIALAGVAFLVAAA